MRITVLLAMAVSLCFHHIRIADAKCCRPDFGGDCGDDSASTPCCGYNKCNGFCCACRGVQIIRQEVEQTDEAGFVFETISVMTAPAGVTWTCRDDHMTKNPPKIRDVADATGSIGGTPTAAAPIITTASHVRGRPTGWSGECDDTLKWVSHGSGNVTLEDYRNYFNVTDEQSDRYKAVDAMFHARDTDNN